MKPRVKIKSGYYIAAAPYPVRPARPQPYLDFEKEKAVAAVAVAAAAARCHYRGLSWLGRARRAGGAPVFYLVPLPPLAHVKT